MECTEGAREETGGKHRADAEKESGIVGLVSGMLWEASKMEHGSRPVRLATWSLLVSSCLCAALQVKSRLSWAEVRGGEELAGSTGCIWVC